MRTDWSGPGDDEANREPSAVSPSTGNSPNWLTWDCLVEVLCDGGFADRQASLVTQIYAQQHRQLAHRFQQIRVVDDVPLAIHVEAIQRVFPVALVVLTDPRRTVSAADSAHGVEGYAGDGIGYQDTSTSHSGHTRPEVARRSWA